VATAFPIHYDSMFVPLFSILGLGPRHSWVRVDDGAVLVRMGWGFRARFAKDQVTSAQPGSGEWFFGVGIHTNLRGRWVVNGSLQRMVALSLNPPATGRCMGLPILIDRLDVSLEDPTGFLDALGASHLPR
jgi:hypothetical protein